MPATPSTSTWTTDDTKMWVHEMHLKLEAVDYWLNETVQWCETNEVYSDKLVFILSFLTILWVGYQLGEPISKQHAFELMGIPDWEKVSDVIMALPVPYGELDHAQLMQLAFNSNLDLP